MSKLLINEHPLMVLPSLAVALNNINAAIVLQQIHYWIADPRAPQREGKGWHYATFEQWLKQFPWISLRSLKRIIDFLEIKNLIISKEFNSLKGDRTKWYTINYQELEALEIFIPKHCAKTEQAPLSTHSAKLALCPPPLCQIGTTIVPKCPDVYKEEETNKETNHKNNNNKIPVGGSGNEADVVVDSEFVNTLAKEGINQLTAIKWCNMFGKKYILEKIKMLQDEIIRGTPIASKAGWLNAALRSNFKPSIEKKMEITHASHQDAKEILKNVSDWQQKASTPESRKKGSETLDKLKGRGIKNAS